MDWESCLVVTKGLLPWWDTCSAKQWHSFLPETLSGNITPALRVHKLLTTALSLPTSCWKLTSTPLILPTTNGLYPPDSTPPIPIFVRIKYVDFTADILELRLHRMTINHLVFAYEYFLEKSYPMRFTGHELKAALKAQFLRGCLDWEGNVGCEGLKAAVGNSPGQGDFVEWSQERVKYLSSTKQASPIAASPEITGSSAWSLTTFPLSEGNVSGPSSNPKPKVTPLTEGERQVILQLRQICAQPSGFGEDGRESSRGVLGYLRNLFIPALEERRNIWGINYTVPAQGWEYEPFIAPASYPEPADESNTSPSSHSHESSSPASIRRLYPEFCNAIGITTPATPTKNRSSKRPANIAENSRGGKVRLHDRAPPPQQQQQHVRAKFIPGNGGGVGGGESSQNINTTDFIVGTDNVAAGVKRKRLQSTCNMADLQIFQNATATANNNTPFSGSPYTPYLSSSSPINQSHGPPHAHYQTAHGNIDENYDRDEDDDDDGAFEEEEHMPMDLSTTPLPNSVITLSQQSLNHANQLPSVQYINPAQFPQQQQQQQYYYSQAQAAIYPPPPIFWPQQYGHPGSPLGSGMPMRSSAQHHRHHHVTTTSTQSTSVSEYTELLDTPSPRTIITHNPKRKRRKVHHQENEAISKPTPKRRHKLKTSPLARDAKKQKRENELLEQEHEQVHHPHHHEQQSATAVYFYPSSSSYPPTPPPPPSQQQPPSSPLPSPRLPKIAVPPKSYSKHRKAMFLSRKLAAQEAERVRLEEVVRVERERQGQVGASVKIEEVDFDDVVAGGEESGEGDSDEPTLPPVPTGGESASAGSGSGSPITAIYISETTGRIAMVETPAGISSSSSSSSSNKQSSKRNHQPQEQSLQKQKDKDKGKQQLRELTPEVPQKVVYYPVKCDDESRWEHIEPGWYEPISSSPLSAPVVITESSGGGSSSNVNNVHESTMVATMHMAVSQEDEGKGRDVRIVVEGGPVAGVAGVAGEEEKKSLSPRSRAREFARRSRAAKLWVNGGEWVRSRKEL